MANRYWVGGTGNWTSGDTTHWSASSGGVGGESVPSSSDSVYFDANSGGGVCYIDNQLCYDIDFTGYTGSTGTYLGHGAINVIRNMIMSPSISYGHTQVQFSSNVSGSLTTNGKTIGFDIEINKSTGYEFKLNDDLTTTSPIRIALGTFNTNNKNISGTYIYFYGNFSRTLLLGSSNISCNTWGPYGAVGSSGTVSITPGTSTITCSKFNGLAGTYNDVIINIETGGGSYISNYGPTTSTTGVINNITAVRATGTSINFGMYYIGTVNGLLSVGVSGGGGYLVIGTGGTSSWVINGTTSFTSCKIQNTTVTGSSSPITVGTSNLDLGGNSGIIFLIPPKVQSQIII